MRLGEIIKREIPAAIQSCFFKNIFLTGNANSDNKMAAIKKATEYLFKNPTPKISEIKGNEAIINIKPTLFLV